MTIQTEFTHWQARDDWNEAPFVRTSPNLSLLAEFLDQRWGGLFLGGHSVRPIRGGSSPSSHAFGAAIDWRYQDPGPGRDVLLGQVLPFLIDNSAELGVQAVHDYVGGRIWRPPASSFRPSDGDGWKSQSKSGAMGASWAAWLHIETPYTSWGDDSPIGERLDDEVAVPPAFPPYVPEAGQYSLWPLGDKPKVGVTSSGHGVNTRGEHVRYLQDVLIHEAGANLTSDGWFGLRTAAAVGNLQAFFGIEVDQWVGPDTWAVVDFLATV